MDNIWSFLIILCKGGNAVTVGVVRVDVGIGRVPALDGPVDAPAETLVPRVVHHHTENSSPGGVEDHMFERPPFSFTDPTINQLIKNIIFTGEL